VRFLVRSAQGYKQDWGANCNYCPKVERYNSADNRWHGLKSRIDADYLLTQRKDKSRRRQVEERCTSARQYSRRIEEQIANRRAQVELDSSAAQMA
jgi:hypothetical protein